METLLDGDRAVTWRDSAARRGFHSVIRVARTPRPTLAAGGRFHCG